MPVVIFQYAMSPYDEWHALAWAGAFVLTVFVLVLNLTVRLLRAQREANERHVAPSIAAPTRPALSHRPSAKIDVRDLDFFYGKTPRAEQRQPGGSGECGHRDHRPVGLRQVDAAAHDQPHLRALSRPARDRRDRDRRPQRARPRATPLSDLRRWSAWCSRSRRRSPRPSASNVAFALSYYERLSKRELDDRVEDALRQAALWDEVKDKLDASALSLSGGQQQRLCIARTIAVRPEIILLDEPTSALDPISTAKIEELIHELRERFTIVIVTHNMQQAARVSQRTAFFHLGELVEFGQHLADLHQPSRAADAGLYHRPVRLTEQDMQQPHGHTLKAFDQDLDRAARADQSTWAAFAEAAIEEAMRCLVQRDEGRGKAIGRRRRAAR